MPIYSSSSSISDAHSPMLWDKHHPTLPFHAVAPWPSPVDKDKQYDWITQVYTVEAWLEQHIGHHYVDWTWDMWSLKQAYYCGVAFKQECSVTMFLLRFGSV
jgi:hypothetical protein